MIDYQNIHMLEKDLHKDLFKIELSEITNGLICPLSDKIPMSWNIIERNRLSFNDQSDRKLLFDMNIFIKNNLPELFAKRSGSKNVNKLLLNELVKNPSLKENIFSNHFLNKIALTYLDKSLFNKYQLAIILTSLPFVSDKKLINKLMGDTFLEHYQGVARLCCNEIDLPKCLKLGENSISKGELVKIHAHLRKNVLPNYLEEKTIALTNETLSF